MASEHSRPPGATDRGIEVSRGRLNVTSNQYDGQDRLVLATAPEGGRYGAPAMLYMEHRFHRALRVCKL